MLLTCLNHHWASRGGEQCYGKVTLLRCCSRALDLGDDCVWAWAQWSLEVPSNPYSSVYLCTLHTARCWPQMHCLLGSTHGVCDCTACSVFYEQQLPFHSKFHWESTGMCRCTAWHWHQSISEQFFASEKQWITSLFPVGCRVYES